MQSDLLIATLTGLSAMIGWGFADFFAKKTIDKVGDLVSLAWAHIFGVGLLAGLVIARSLNDGAMSKFPAEGRELALLAGFGALQALVYYFAYKAFSKGKLALLNPVFSTYSALVVIISVFVLGELLSSSILIILGLIFVGVILINLDEPALHLKKLKLSKIEGLADILTAVVLATVWTVSWGRFVSGKDWLVYAALMYLFMSVTILLIASISKVSLKVTDKTIWKYFFMIGLAEVVAYVGISVGFSITSHLSIVAVLSAAFSVPTVILAHLFLKEQITRLQLGGVTLVIIGVVLISLI